LIERRTRKGGRVFYGCNKFPKCKYATWKKPGEEGAEAEVKKGKKVAPAKKSAGKTVKAVAKKAVKSKAKTKK
jgi:ssDNA-binding Zn-finger/Zn-ribbon topoisomerase 1